MIQSNFWLVTVDIKEILQESTLSNPLSVHTLIAKELDKGGLLDTIAKITAKRIEALIPEIVSDEAWPDYLAVSYCNPYFNHFYPGTEDLIELASLQPPTFWTVRAYLVSNVVWPGGIDMHNPPVFDRP